jgi:hypothetical protein
MSTIYLNYEKKEILVTVVETAILGQIETYLTPLAAGPTIASYINVVNYTR